MTNTIREDEVAFIRALHWEIRWLMMTGPAHRLAEEHGISRYQIDVLTMATHICPSLDELFDGLQIHPNGWPWGDMKYQEIFDSLKSRYSDANERPK